MSADGRRELSTSKKRRGIARGSITRLETRLVVLEAKPEVTPDEYEQVLRKLEQLDTDFRKYHLAIVDFTDDDEALDTEQEALDIHDDRVTALHDRLRQLIAKSSASRTTDSDTRRRLAKRMKHLEDNLTLLASQVDSTSAESDVCFVRQCEDELNGLKMELSVLACDIIDMDDEDEELIKRERRLRKEILDKDLKLKQLLHKSPTHGTPPTSEKGGLKLPKLDVPTFDGSVILWRAFWEQFQISVHDQKSLSNSEKLVYLKHALKDGAARQVVEGLSRSGDQYAEAVACLQGRYDRPRLIHQAHVRAILEAPSLKDGDGRELRRLHDVVNQHLRALRSMDYEPSGPFITSMLELKLDANTKFEWQKFSQDTTDVPHYRDLLEFINLCAQASETSLPEQSKKQPFKSYSSFHTSVDEFCVACKTQKHPLYICHHFRSLPHEHKTLLVKNKMCFNCLKPGHFVSQCPSNQRCKKCQRPHHSLLHAEPKSGDGDDKVPPNNSTPTHISHVARTDTLQKHILLMTCRVLVVTPDGLTTQARALLNSASSTSFVSERLVQRLRLPRRSQLAHISGIGGVSNRTLSQSVVHFAITHTAARGKTFDIQAIVLPRVTSALVCTFCTRGVQEKFAISLIRLQSAEILGLIIFFAIHFR